MSTTETAARLPAPARMTPSSRLRAVALMALLTAFAAHAHAASADRAAQRAGLHRRLRQCQPGRPGVETAGQGSRRLPAVPLPARRRAGARHRPGHAGPGPGLPRALAGPAAGQRPAQGLPAELARRRDWSAFRTLYQPGLGTGLTCDKLLADINGGRQLSYRHDLAPLWQQASLPGDCNPVLDWAHAHGLLTRERLWQRIDIAAEAGRAGVVASLARWLHGNDARHARRVVQALRHPAQAARCRARLARQPAQPQYREHGPAPPGAPGQHAGACPVAEPAPPSAFQHRAAPRHRIRPGPVQRHRLRPGLGAPPARPAGPAADRSTRGWRMRVALAARDWQGVLDAWSAMPARAAARPGVDLFPCPRPGRAGPGRGRAQAQYATLADQTTYFGFLAADRLQQPYTICPATSPTTGRARRPC